MLCDVVPIAEQTEFGKVDVGNRSIINQAPSSSLLLLLSPQATSSKIYSHMHACDAIHIMRGACRVRWSRQSDRSTISGSRMHHFKATHEALTRG